MSSAPQHVVRIDVQDTAVLVPVGEFDLACSEILRESFKKALNETSRIVVDLSETSFLDSTALGAILAAGRRAGQSEGWVRLVAPRSNVRKILRITQIDAVLGLYDTVGQAIAHVAELDPDLEEATPA